MTSELSSVPTDDMVRELLSRDGKLFTEQGLLRPPRFNLAGLLGIRFCVDGAPARTGEDGRPELMAIRRGTGSQAGKLCLIGGGVERIRQEDGFVPESVEEALRRHFRTDLGYEIEPLSGSWTRPDYLAQDMRPVDGEVRPGFTPNPASRHLIAARYLVKVTNANQAPAYGATELGGQEAAGVEWFNEATMPTSTEFGYGHDETYRALFPVASQLLLSKE